MTPEAESLVVKEVVVAVLESNTPIAIDQFPFQLQAILVLLVCQARKLRYCTLIR